MISTGSVSAADCGGTTECNCGDTVTSSYTMSADITDCPFYGLRIGAPGITLDCAGFTISGAGSNTRAGIASDSNGVGGITVKNCNVEHFPTQAGISLFGDGNTIMENTILNVSAGIGISGYNDNMIIDNTVINSSWGFDSGPGCDLSLIHI